MYEEMHFSTMEMGDANDQKVEKRKAHMQGGKNERKMTMKQL